MPNCKNTNIKKYDDGKRNKKNKKHECKNSTQTKEKQNKYVQFVQEMYDEASYNDENSFAPFGFLHVGGRHELDLINMILIDN